MSDYISRQAAIDAIMDEVEPFAIVEPGTTCVIGIGVNNNDIVRVLEQLPSAQPEREKGKWVKIPGMNEYCSACNQFFPLSYFQGRPFEINYCPHCGAMMEVAQDE